MYLPCGMEPPVLPALDDGLLLPAAFGSIAVWLGGASLTEDCGLLPVWLGIELSEAVEDGVAPLPALRLPLPPSGFEPFGMFASFEGEAMLGEAALLPEPEVTASPADGFGVVLMAGLPAAGSGVCAKLPASGNSNRAAIAAPDKPKRI